MEVILNDQKPDFSSETKNSHTPSVSLGLLVSYPTFPDIWSVKLSLPISVRHQSASSFFAPHAYVLLSSSVCVYRPIISNRSHWVITNSLDNSSSLVCSSVKSHQGQRTGPSDLLMLRPASETWQPDRLHCGNYRITFQIHGALIM